MSVLTALAVCFYSSWELSLILLLAFPLVFLSYRIANKLYQSTGSGDDDHLQASAHVVIESVDHIKTVVALGAEEYFVRSINNYLHSHTRYTLQPNHISLYYGIIYRVSSKSIGTYMYIRAHRHICMQHELRLIPRCNLCDNLGLSFVVTIAVPFSFLL